MNDADIQSIVKTYILNEFLPGEDPSALTDAVQLISGGILDSIAVLKLVTYLEEKFEITIEAHETGMDNFNSIADIVRLIRAKLN
jgi:acyl carrier protein